MILRVTLYYCSENIKKNARQQKKNNILFWFWFWILVGFSDINARWMT